MKYNMCCKHQELNYKLERNDTTLRLYYILVKRTKKCLINEIKTTIDNFDNFLLNFLVSNYN